MPSKVLIMSGRQFESEPAPLNKLQDDETVDSPDEPSCPEGRVSFLDEILQATSASDLAAEETWKRSHAGFLRVARAYQGVDFCIDPIGHALVEAVLEETLNEQLVSAADRALLSREIGAQLAADPTAAPRLKAFWKKLQDAVS